jgi:hypothetical protein
MWSPSIIDESNIRIKFSLLQGYLRKSEVVIHFRTICRLPIDFSGCAEKYQSTFSLSPNKSQDCGNCYLEDDMPNP